MSFSKRLGFLPEKTLQLNDIDQDLKNSLWNVFSNFSRSYFTRYGNISKDHSPDFKEYIQIVWSDFFKLPIDDLPLTPNLCMDLVRINYSKLPWFRVYDFTEFNIQKLFKLRRSAEANNYIEACNKILKQESSGYRIVNKQIVPISNEIELEEIKNVLSNNSISNVNTHIETALTLLSDKSKPDYRNSIKESISAVETLCREITGENTLGKAIKKFEKSGVYFNQQFKDALEKLYAYTNNKETGIRHALLETQQMPDFDEAKFMLVACSAFVNYLLSKSDLIKR